MRARVVGVRAGLQLRTRGHLRRLLRAQRGYEHERYRNRGAQFAATMGHVASHGFAGTAATVDVSATSRVFTVASCGSDLGASATYSR